MSARRTATPRPAPAGGAVSTPLINAALLALAVSYGLWLLVTRGRVGWPPHQLLGSLYTVAGAFALIGPIVLLRREATDGALGELIWLTVGLLVWLYDIAAILRGEFTTLSPATPLAAVPLGLVVLAVAVAGWRTRGAGRSWSWTNVTGWLLGLFWIGMAIGSLWPATPSVVAAR